MITFFESLSENQIYLLLIFLFICLTLVCQCLANCLKEAGDDLFTLPQSADQTVEGFKANTSHHYFSSPSDHIPDGKYLIVGSRNDRICRDDPNGVICNSDFPNPDNYFTVQTADSSQKQYFIRGGRSDNWCTLTTAGVICNQFMSDDNSLFRIQSLGNGKYGIKNVINDMWCSESGYGLVCKAPKLYGTDFEEFRFIPVREPNIK